jgi:ethanolamine utilization protein EutL
VTARRRPLVDLPAALLSCRQIDRVDPQLGRALGLDPERHVSAGLVTCTQDDALYIALDHATKFAPVEVRFAQSFYAGAQHASGPFSGEVLGVLCGRDPEEVAEGLWALGEVLPTISFKTFAGRDGKGGGQPALLAHVIPSVGSYLAAEAQVPAESPLAYLIAPPAEALVAVDAALKVAPVHLAKLLPPPSPTNFAGAYLAGALPDLEAARDAFIEAVADFAAQPLRAARRPSRLRR